MWKFKTIGQWEGSLFPLPKFDAMVTWLGPTHKLIIHLLIHLLLNRLMEMSNSSYRIGSSQNRKIQQTSHNCKRQFSNYDGNCIKSTMETKMRWIWVTLSFLLLGVVTTFKMSPRGRRTKKVENRWFNHTVFVRMNWIAKRLL